jgi:predicted adenine nucleotide alpha hydrolase (AANH) superfamily ATPase
MEKKLLLHVCCAPCAVYVHQILSREYQVTCFFYNPNIHPVKEYRSRKKELERIAAVKQWDVIYADYPMKEWFQLVRGHEKDPERGERCSICFNMRLKRTIEYAGAGGFAAAATTLSISPYKVTRRINARGEELGRQFGVKFLAENFKKQNGYNIGREMAREMGIKHQDYCGCVYSRVEKKLKMRKKTINSPPASGP